MADDERNVNHETSGIEVGRWYVRAWSNCRGWMEQRPLLGWYIAAIGTVNVVLTMLQLIN